MNPHCLHEKSALWASTAAFSGLRSGLALRPSTLLGILSLSKDRCEAPGRNLQERETPFLQARIRETKGFVNYVG